MLQPKTILQPMNPDTADMEPVVRTASGPALSKSRSVADGWEPPPGRPPGDNSASHPFGIAPLTSDDWYKLQSEFPISYTPFGTYGKNSISAVCALHWPTDHGMMRQRMSHLIAGQTVDESISHLIIDKAVSKHTGTTVTMALDTLCGPCGVISYEMARRLGYDVDSLLPQSLRAPTQTDLTGNARPLLPVEPAPKPIHSVDGSPLQIFGRINGLKLCVNNQHDLEFDVLVGGAAVGCDVIVGMPSLAKHEMVLNCKRGIAHFRDLAGNLGVFGRGVQRLAQLPTPDDVTSRVSAVGATLPTGSRIDITDAVDPDLRHTDHAAYLQQRLESVARFAASRLRRAAVMRRELYHDVDAFLSDASKRQNRAGFHCYPELREWCLELAEQHSASLRRDHKHDHGSPAVIDWPIGPMYRAPLPPMTLNQFWESRKWEEPERRAITKLLRRFANIASARREAIEYANEIGVCEQCIRDHDAPRKRSTTLHKHKPPATAEASIGGGKPKKGESDVEINEKSVTINQVAQVHSTNPWPHRFVDIPASQLPKSMHGRQPRYNAHDWARPDRCPESYRQPGNLKCRLDGEGGIDVLPPNDEPDAPRGILNWARHHRKCTAWKKDLARSSKPRFAFVNEHYGETQSDGCGYAHSEEDHEGGNLPGGRPEGFNAKAPSSCDIEYMQALKCNTTDARHDALQWANLEDYGGSPKLVSHHNRLSAGSDEELMLMALRAFAIWNGTHGPNQRTYSRPEATGTAKNRMRRSPGGIGHEYAYSSFRQFLTESGSSNYWSTDHYYRKTHLHLGPGAVTPETTDHSPPWKSLSRKRGAHAEAWSSFYDHHAVTLCETYMQAGVRPRLVKLDLKNWQAWPVSRDEGGAGTVQPLNTYTRHREDQPVPELRALPQRPRRAPRIPRDMYAKAHLVDGPTTPAPTRDPQEILREASAQAVEADSQAQPVSLVDLRLLEQAAAAPYTHTVAAALPAHAVCTVEGRSVTHEMVSADEFQADLQKFDSDGQHLVEEAILPGCSVEVGNNGKMLKLHIHNDRVNALHDPLRTSEDQAIADQLLDATTTEERAGIIDSIMWTIIQEPHQAHTAPEDDHIRYKPEDAVSLVAKVPGKTVVSPGASPELVSTIDAEHAKAVPGQVHALMAQLGVTEKHFKAEFSEWDKQHAVKFQYRPTGEPPPQEHRKIARGLLEAVAEQLRAFMKAGWIYRIYEAETCAPVVVVPKKDGSVRITVDYSTINKELLPRAWSMPDVTDTIHQLRDMAKESYRQIKANRSGARTSQADDDPDSGQRAGITVDDLEDPGMSRLGKTDVQKAFHRILVDDPRKVLAFSAPQLGLFTWRVLPMGATQSPAAWCSLSTKMLERAGLLYNPGGHDASSVRAYLQELYQDMSENDWLTDGFELRNGELYIDGFLAPSQFAILYVDDVTTVSAAPEGSFGMEGDDAAMHEHLRQWKLLIAVCRHQRLFLAAPKTAVGCECIRLLGLCVTHKEVFADPERIKAFAEIPEPKTKSDCRCFCGLGNFYRNFCELFAVILGPIYMLTKDDVPDKDVTAHFTIPLPEGHPRADTHFGVKADENKLDAQGRYAGREVERTKDSNGTCPELSCREAWQLVKDRMCELTLLAQPDISKPMTIFTDSSQYAGAGAIANELTPGTLRIFDVWSRNFSPEQRNYSASEREALSIVLSCKKWYGWICSAKFTIRMRTDHMALINARQKINNARITSWFAQLAALDFTISYVRGTSPLLLVPDALSRLTKSYTDEELREQWVEGEHLLKVPCFEHIYRRMQPEQPIHTYKGVDTYDPPLDAVQAAHVAADLADDGASDCSDVFDYDDPFEQVVDDEELEMNKFAADTAARFGGDIVRGVNSAQFFDSRQAVQTKSSLDAQQTRLLERINSKQSEHTFPTVTPTATDYLQRTVATAHRRSTRAATKAATDRSQAKAQKPKVTIADSKPTAKATKPATARVPGMAKGELSQLDGATVFVAHHNSSFDTIARRFGLDAEELLKINQKRKPEWSWPQDSPKRKAIDVRMGRSSVFLTDSDADELPKDLAASGPTPSSKKPAPPPDQPVDEATASLLSTPYGEKSVHGEMNTAEKRWKLTRQSYEQSAEFGELFKRLGKMRVGSMVKQEPRHASTKDGKPGKLTVIGTYHGTFQPQDSPSLLSAPNDQPVADRDT